MINKHIFCNSPWYELQIYWDGSLGFCCQEDHKIYDEIDRDIYNVKNMSIAHWFDSDPMRRARLMMFGTEKNSVCRRCYVEEEYSTTSRRHRCNQKSVIFTRENFEESYAQSPGLRYFEHAQQNNGAYSGLPIDLHIDLGNYCNLSCKMCNTQASSSIAVQYHKWGILDNPKHLNQDWTQDQSTWTRVLEELAKIPNLKNVHFMGGETLLTKKFEEFVDYMISHGRQDLCFSFVTNGTHFRKDLMDKLKQFARVGIEVSIETLTPHNQYQRQGTDNNQVLENMSRYLDYCDGDSKTLTIRPALSLLTVGNYHTLLQYALDHNVIVKSLPVTTPRYLWVPILPDSVKEQYKQVYLEFMNHNQLTDLDCDQDYNESDPHEIKRIVKNQILLAQNLLSQPRPVQSDDLLKQMVEWCRRWDRVHGYDAITLYPELRECFIAHGYQDA